MPEMLSILNVNTNYVDFHLSSSKRKGSCIWLEATLIVE